jgi:hypothetical protein
MIEVTRAALVKPILRTAPRMPRFWMLKVALDMNNAVSLAADLAPWPQQRDAAGLDVLIRTMPGRVDFDHSLVENVMIDVTSDLCWERRRGDCS